MIMSGVRNLIFLVGEQAGGAGAGSLYKKNRIQ